MEKLKDESLKEYSKYTWRKITALIVIFVFTLVFFFLSIGIGTMSISLADIFKVFFGQGEEMYTTVIMNIRLPRAVSAILVGACLAASGAVMQCVLNNPLASSSSLGVSQGAAFGAALGIVLLGGGAISSSGGNVSISVDNFYIVTICSFIFGIISTIIVIAISQLKPTIGAGGLILAGTALSSLFTGASTLLQYFSDDTKLGAIVFWTFGNLGNTTWPELLVLFIVFVLVMIYFMFNRWNYNAMDSGLVVAKSLGVNSRVVMLVSMVLCSLLTAIAVSFVGIIGFIGLVAPHMVRKFVGNDYRYLIPGSALAGALLLLIADLISRCLMSPIILPIGALTSILGAPVFLILLFKGSKRHG